MSTIPSSGAPGFDPAEFRRALGAFATGVTVVTTRSADGAAVGLTANSFNSVSLNPPLVLWSLAKNALSLPAFLAAQHWVVHILAGDQEAVSKRFASRGSDKFSGIEVDAGIGGMPLLRGCAARFQCRTAFTYEGGDHMIFVGEVLEFDRSQAAPLVFHAGQYAWTMQKDLQAGALTGRFAEDFLGYLLGRSHSQFYRQLKQQMRAAGIGDDEQLLLGALSTRGSQSADELEAALSHLLSGDLRHALDSLVSRGYIHRDDDGARHTLAPPGQEFALRIIAVSKAYEAQMTERFGDEDIHALKAMLRKLVTLTHSPTGDTTPGNAHV